MSRKYIGRSTLRDAPVSVPRLWYGHDYRFNLLSEEFIGAGSATAFCTDLWHDDSYGLDGMRGIPELTVCILEFITINPYGYHLRFQPYSNILK